MELTRSTNITTISVRPTGLYALCIDKHADSAAVYEKYLEPMRNKKFKMLEIGLGCNMGYGPGASYGMWLEFFPNVDLVCD